EWAVADEDDQRILNIFFQSGQIGSVAIVLQGTLGEPAEATEFDLPVLRMFDTDRQTGTIVVQSDPTFDVATPELVGLQRTGVQRAYGWITAKQRSLSRVALLHTEEEYSGTVRLMPRQPLVRAVVVTNVRVTDRAIEETILLDYKIYNAGIREVTFLLPRALADARISVPLLREKTVTPV